MVTVIILSAGIVLETCSIPPQFNYNSSDRPVIIRACGKGRELDHVCYDVDSNTIRLYIKQSVSHFKTSEEFDCRLIFQNGFEFSSIQK